MLSGILAVDAPPCDELVPDLDTLLAGADLIVEAAGHGALVEHGRTVLAAGHDLIMVSAGALADDVLRTELWAAGPGRLMISTGAIGGIDTLRAAMLAGGLDRVEVTSTKPSRVLIHDWMSVELATALENGTERVTVFDGPARQAVRLLPASVNIAATVSLATIGFDRTRVHVVGDPAATSVEHIIRASGAAGDYEFRFRNRPSPDNPRTSGIVPFAVLRALRDRGARVVVGA